MTDLVSFRIEIPNASLVAVTTKASVRAERFIYDVVAGHPEATIEWHRNHIGQTTVIGKAPRSVINVLMAVVDREDLNALLDAYEEDP